MIIHPDDPDEPEPLPTKEDEEEETENDTGTMIIKTVESEFQKSDNWNMILSKEKKKETSKKNLKSYKKGQKSGNSVKSKEKLTSP